MSVIRFIVWKTKFEKNTLFVRLLQRRRAWVKKVKVSIFQQTAATFRQIMGAKNFNFVPKFRPPKTGAS